MTTPKAASTTADIAHLYRTLALVALALGLAVSYPASAGTSGSAALMRSGIDCTILRPSFFMEFWLDPAVGFDHANAKATGYGTGRNPISWVSQSDVAGFAAAFVDDPNASRAVIELGGPQALNPLEVIGIFEEHPLRAQQAAATDTLQQAFAALMLSYARGDSIAMEATQRRDGLQLRSVSEYVRATPAPDRSA